MDERVINILLVEDDEVDIMTVKRAFAKNNITTERYSAGHMMYIDETSAKKLRADLAKFYDAALKPQTVLP